MRPPGVPHWSDDECAFLQEFVLAHGHQWVQASREMAARFGDRRPYGADMLRKKWRQICLKNGGGQDPTTPPRVTRRPHLNWTEVEEEVLLALVDELGENWPQVARGLVDRLGEIRKYSARTVEAKWASMPEGRRSLTLASVPVPTTATPGWKDEHDQYLSMLVAMYPDDWQKMAQIFEKRFQRVRISVDDLKLHAKALEMRRKPPMQPTASPRRKRASGSSTDLQNLSKPSSKRPATASQSPKKLKLNVNSKPELSFQRKQQAAKTRNSIATPMEVSATKVKEEVAPGVEGPDGRPRAKSCLIQ